MCWFACWWPANFSLRPMKALLLGTRGIWLCQYIFSPLERICVYWKVREYVFFVSSSILGNNLCGPRRRQCAFHLLVFMVQKKNFSTITRFFLPSAFARPVG